MFCNGYLSLLYFWPTRISNFDKNSSLPFLLEAYDLRVNLVIYNLTGLSRFCSTPYYPWTSVFARTVLESDCEKILTSNYSSSYSRPVRANRVYSKRTWYSWQKLQKNEFKETTIDEQEMKVKLRSTFKINQNLLKFINHGRICK